MKVGDFLWREDIGSRSKPVRIVKLSKFHAHLEDGDKVKLSTMRSSWNEPYWLSREAFEEDRAKIKVWRDFHLVLNNRPDPPKHLSLTDIYRLIKTVQEGA